MPRIVRAQVALETGERLQDLGRKSLTLAQYSGEALDSQRSQLATALRSCLNQLDTLVRSCRAGRNSYPNYKSLRLVLRKAGDEVYDIKCELDDSILAIADNGDIEAQGAKLLELGQRLRLVQFVPEDNIAATGS